MIIRITKKRIFLFFAAVIVGILFALLATRFLNRPSGIVAGGTMHPAAQPDIAMQAVIHYPNEALSERFQRPSKEEALPNKYSFNYFVNPDEETLGVMPSFQTPQDVIYAYYGLLKEAENMQGFTGGCGSIGDAKQPFAYAYQLFTKEKQSKMSLCEFIRSFKGIGHTTFLKIHPAYSTLGTPPGTQYFMVEVEGITGRPTEENTFDYKQQISYFAYCYGIVTVENTPSDGYKIAQIDYLPEEFLCAPYHGWAYDSEMTVELIYKDALKIISTIERTEQKDGLIMIYASDDEKYRFDFVRLTNGHDILLHENIFRDGQWQQTDLPTGSWESLKLSIKNFCS